VGGDGDRRGFEVESSRVVLDDFFRVEEVVFRRRNEDGELADPQRSLSLERGDSAAVLLHNVDTDRVILVVQVSSTRQWRLDRGDDRRHGRPQ